MNSAYTWLVANVLFPIHEIAKRHDSVAVRRAHERSQWLQPQALQERQLARLRELLVHAGRSVPYYRQLFAELGFRPEALASIGELARLPLLSKADIRRTGDALMAADAVGLSRFTTGGSSGEPLVFSIGRRRVSHDIAAKWRATRWWNVDIGDAEIVLWGSPIELGAQDRWRKVRDRVIRSHLYPAFDLSAANVGRLLEQLRTIRPRHLFGYPSAWSLVARAAEKRGVRMDDLGTRVVFVTAERLYPEQREVIERVFGCKVANGYGSRDAGFIAHECPSGGMHITAEDIIVEIIDSDGKPVPRGQSGEIVVTNLATRDFPSSAIAPATWVWWRATLCLRPRPAAVAGSAGQDHGFRGGPRWHRHARTGFDLRCASWAASRPSRSCSTACSTRACWWCRVPASRHSMPSASSPASGAASASAVAVDVEVVQEIPAEKSGKHRYVISHVAP